jgi:phytoene/squalene synthetase
MSVPDQGVAACAALVATGDPDRFRAIMAAPVALRERLFPLAAFALEIARAPWVTEEPMIAEMRLQFWRDTLEEAAAGKPPRAHEVAAPLARVLVGQRLPVEVLDRAVAARRWDIYRDPFENEAALDGYLDDTGAGLMWVAALACGARGPDEAPVRAIGRAHALARFLVAVPDLEARGRVPLVDGRPEAVAALARRGLQDLKTGLAARVANPALYEAVTAGPILSRAAKEPGAVAQGRLVPPRAVQSLRLMRAALRGRL